MKVGSIISLLKRCGASVNGVMLALYLLEVQQVPSVGKCMLTLFGNQGVVYTGVHTKRNNNKLWSLNLKVTEDNNQGTTPRKTVQRDYCASPRQCHSARFTRALKEKILNESRGNIHHTVQTHHSHDFHWLVGWKKLLPSKCLEMMMRWENGWLKLDGNVEKLVSQYDKYYIKYLDRLVDYAEK